MKHWTDDHITFAPSSALYTGWDETGSNIVRRSNDRSEVVAALEQYSKELEVTNTKNVSVE